MGGETTRGAAYPRQQTCVRDCGVVAVSAINVQSGAGWAGAAEILCEGPKTSGCLSVGPVASL